MKSLKSKVLLSGIVALFALIATVGSTFAWFTVASQVNVQSLELNVKTEESLLIRVYNGEASAVADPTLLDATTYVQTLTNALITGSSEYTDLLNWTLSPVTVIQSGYTTVNGKTMNYLNGLVDFARPLAAISETPVTGDVNKVGGRVIELKFWLLSQGEVAKNIELGSLAINGLNGSGDVRNDVVNAIRLSVWSGSGDAFIYGLDQDYGYEFKVNLPGYFGGTVDPLAGTEFNVIDDLDAHDSLITALAAATYTSVEFASADIITALAYNTPTLVTVRIFVEGWDASTTNNVIAAAFNIAFSFKFQA